MQRIRFRLDLTSEQVLAHYQGAVRQIQVIATDGRRVRFPAENLRPFVATDGVHGLFEMSLAKDHRLIALRRV